MVEPLRDGPGGGQGWRLGQGTDVWGVSIPSEGTVDDRVVEARDKKAKLGSSLVGEMGSKAKLTKEEFLRRLEPFEQKPRQRPNAPVRSLPSQPWPPMAKESLLAVDSKVYSKTFILSTNKLASEWTGLPVDHTEPPFLARRLNEAIVDAAAAHGRGRRSAQR